ncbi:hypothetical protein ACIBG0_40230 [Nocardia sp. NPDC050630]|uniref:hypothetical protein n=1 Tax=Nocardia sp. NPDC050630 TaxID=3364321 RepID=UPI00379F7465
MRFNAIRAALTVVAVSAALLGGQTLTTTPAQAGPCLFGHVDPNNDNSACRGSDSANFPESEANPDGSPKLACTRLNEGQNVKTHDAHGWLYWGCKAYKDQWGNKTYQWTEFVLD